MTRALATSAALAVYGTAWAVGIDGRYVTALALLAAASLLFCAALDRRWDLA